MEKERENEEETQGVIKESINDVNWVLFFVIRKRQRRK